MLSKFLTRGNGEKCRRNGRVQGEVKSSFILHMFIFRDSLDIQVEMLGKEVG